MRPRSSFARANTASSISTVSLPVNVFCWLGWYEPRSAYGPTLASAMWPNRGFGRGVSMPAGAQRAKRPVPRERPEAHDHAHAAPAAPSSRARYGTHSSRSTVVGLLSGGAHLTTAETYAPSRRSPSPASHARRLIRKPGPVHRRIEPVARAIPREHPPRPVRAMRRRRQPHHRDRRLGVAKPGQRTRPVVLAAEALGRIRGARLAPRNQPRARRAGRDLARSERSIESCARRHPEYFHHLMSATQAHRITAAACSPPPALPSPRRSSSPRAADPSDADDDRSEENDPDLLNAILEQHLAVEDAANAGRRRPASRRHPRARCTAQGLDLRARVASSPSATARPPPSQPTRPQAESATEALILQLEASIEASLASIGDLSSPAYRQAVHRYITEDAAALAALRSETRRRGRARRVRLRRAGIRGGRRMSAAHPPSAPGPRPRRRRRRRSARLARRRRDRASPGRRGRRRRPTLSSASSSSSRPPSSPTRSPPRRATSPRDAKSLFEELSIHAGDHATAFSEAMDQLLVDPPVLGQRPRGVRQPRGLRPRRGREGPPRLPHRPRARA